jgi:hypothetical protein
MLEHRPPGYLVEDLREFGVHAAPQTGREDDYVDVSHCSRRWLNRHTLIIVPAEAQE